MNECMHQVWTFMWGVPLGLHKYETKKALNLAVIGGGVAMAAMGATEGSVVGMLIQLLGIIVSGIQQTNEQISHLHCSGEQNN